MLSVITDRKILLLIILLSSLALYLESCKKAGTWPPAWPPAVNNSTDTTKTKTLPIITTTTVGSITATSAITGGNITSIGGLAILSRGVVWSTRRNPTIALSTKTTDSTNKFH